MRQNVSQQEAVRLAKERLGDVTSKELAAYVQEHFGLKIKPVIVTVLLGTLQERATLDRVGQATREKSERWKVDNPDEAKKMAATIQKREAAKRRKTGAGATQVADASVSPPNVSAIPVAPAECVEPDDGVSS